MLVRWILGLAVTGLLTACNIPSQVKTYHGNGYLKERYWAYQHEGREVLTGLYTSWHPNGEKQVEIYYVDGVESSRSYYDEKGLFIGTIEVAKADWQ